MGKRFRTLCCFVMMILLISFGICDDVKSTEDGKLPERYDLRELGLVTDVKNQGKYQMCVAFASAAAIESNALVQGYGRYDISEYYLAYIANNIMSDGMNAIADEGVKSTGNWWYSGTWEDILVSIFMKGYAIKEENEFPYENIEKEIINDGSLEDGELYLDSCYSVLATDSEAIKRLIMKNGAMLMRISTSAWASVRNCNVETGGVYLPEFTKDAYLNHTVAVVGWDDKYSRENFNTMPPGDGAWILKNSWGTDYGDGGYWYLSYYDATINDTNHLISMVVTNEKPYERIYQYDGGPGVYFLDGVTDVIMNINAVDNELITGIRIKPTDVTITRDFEYAWEFKEVNADIAVYKGVFNGEEQEGKLVYTQKNAISYPNYQTISLDEGVKLYGGESYYIRVTFDRPITYGMDGARLLSLTRIIAGAEPGETFVKVFNGEEGEKWYDAVKTPGSNPDCSACIKVLVRHRELSKAEILCKYMSERMVLFGLLGIVFITIVVLLIIKFCSRRRRGKNSDNTLE